MKKLSSFVAALLACGQLSQAASLALLMPEKANLKAPSVFTVRFTTTKGVFEVQAHRDWAPNGVDRFYNLVRAGFYDNCAFFRVVQGFMVQFGVNGDPRVAAKWQDANIPDDPNTEHHNTRGAITFATAGPNTRTTQVFINFADNSWLDPQGFTPFGQVTQGMDVVDKLYNGYGDGPPRGAGPDQGRIQAEGNAYLKKDFPKLDYIQNAVVLSGPAPAPKKR